MLRSIKRTAALFLSVFLVVAWQSPAFAVDGYQETVAETPSGTQADLGCDPDKLENMRRSFGWACFYQYGDDFWISDQAEEGKSVAIQWKLTNGSRSGLIRDKLGYQVSSMLRKDFSESDVIKWRMGRCNVTSTNDCHQASDFVDWGTGVSGAEAFCTPAANDSFAGTLCNWP